MILAIDFDGTCVTHAYPIIGKDIGAVPVLKKLVEKGHKLILFTMRGKDESIKPDTLDSAIGWFNHHSIPLFGINENPGQSSWTASNKVYAQLYIDDAALGCPLIYDTTVSNRPYVDWKAVEEWLIKNKVL